MHRIEWRAPISREDIHYMSFDRKSLREWAASYRDDWEALLERFVNIPTVSAEPERLKDMRRGVDAAVETIRSFGGKATVIRTEGFPIVHGAFRHSAKAPTVTVYNHLDVQPASRETEPWTTDPFVMEKHGDRYLGRGTTDDKGPALAALYGVLAAREADLPINMNVLWEFEEEIGSPSFEEGIAGVGDRIRTDSVVVSDTIWVARNRPACPAGLRGLVGFTIRLQTAETDQHSGTTGGVARNPLGELMQLVSEMHDARTGRVKVRGFYDGVARPARSELRDFADSGFTIKAFKRDHGFRSLRTEDALDAMKRLWALPTFEVHGVVGGYTGPGIKTVIPPAAEVKITCRLVPDQDPEHILEIMETFVAERLPDAEFEADKSMYPYLAPTEGELADTVREAMRFSFGKTPVFVREGGSIGAVVSMERVFGCPVMFLGLSLPEHGYHAPNENFDWQQASGGMVAFARYFELLSGARS